MLPAQHGVCFHGFVADWLGFARLVCSIYLLKTLARAGGGHTRTRAQTARASDLGRLDAWRAPSMLEARLYELVGPGEPFGSSRFSGSSDL